MTKKWFIFYELVREWFGKRGFSENEKLFLRDGIPWEKVLFIEEREAIL